MDVDPIGYGITFLLEIISPLPPIKLNFERLIVTLSVWWSRVMATKLGSSTRVRNKFNNSSNCSPVLFLSYPQKVEKWLSFSQPLYDSRSHFNGSSQPLWPRGWQWLASRIDWQISQPLNDSGSHLCDFSQPLWPSGCHYWWQNFPLCEGMMYIVLYISL